MIRNVISTGWSLLLEYGTMPWGGLILCPYIMECYMGHMCDLYIYIYIYMSMYLLLSSSC